MSENEKLVIITTIENENPEKATIITSGRVVSEVMSAKSIITY